MKSNHKGLLIICTFILGALLMLNYYSDQSVTFLASDCVTSQTGEVIGEDGSVTIDETSQFNGGFLYSQLFNLNKGKYSLRVSYQGDKENIVVVNSNLGQIYNLKLPSSSSVTTEVIDFELSQDCDTAQFIFVYNGNGSISIKDMTLSGNKPFFTDALFLGALVILLGFCLYLYCQKIYSGKIKKENMILGIVFIAAVILASYPLFTNYLIQGHDLNYHLSRIEGIKDGLIGGQFPVDIYPQTNFGYGYLGSLYPSLFLYFPAFLRILGISMATSYKTLLFLINIVTILITYYSLRHMSCSKHASIVAAIVYCLLPYRLTNLYIRASLGETLALIFIPLFIAGIYQIIMGNNKRWYLLAFAFTGLIHSHILSVLICGGLCALLILVFFRNFLKDKRCISLLKAVLATILMNLWYVASFLYYFKGNFNSGAFSVNFSEYTVFPQQLFQTFVNIGDSLVKSKGSYQEMPQTLGLIGFFSLVIILLFLIYDNEKKTTLYQFSVALFTLTLLFILATTTLFPWEVFQKVKLINKIVEMIQFPWRLLGFAGALLSVLIGVLIERHNSFTKYKYIFIGVLGLLLTLGSVSLMDAYANQEISYSQISGGYTYTAPEDYLPAGTTKDIFTVTSPIVSSEDDINIKSYQKTGTTVNLTYSCNTGNGYIDLPLLYYKGYEASSNGTAVEITKSPENRLRILLKETESDITLIVKRQINPFIIITIVFSSIFTAGIFYSILSLYRKK